MKHIVKSNNIIAIVFSFVMVFSFVELPRALVVLHEGSVLLKYINGKLIYISIIVAIVTALSVFAIWKGKVVGYLLGFLILSFFIYLYTDTLDYFWWAPFYLITNITSIILVLIGFIGSFKNEHIVTTLKPILKLKRQIRYVYYSWSILMGVIVVLIMLNPYLDFGVFIFQAAFWGGLSVLLGSVLYISYIIILAKRQRLLSLVKRRIIIVSIFSVLMAFFIVFWIMFSINAIFNFLMF